VRPVPRRAHDRSRRGVVTAVAAVLLPVAAAGCGTTSPPTTPDAAPRASSAGDPAPAPSEQGAQQRAVDLVLLLGRAEMLRGEVRDRTLDDVAVPEAVPELRGRFPTASESPAAAALDTALSAGGSSLVAPVASHVVSYSDGAAVVRVWAVAVTATPGMPGALESWSTEELHLRWHSGSWRLAAYSSEEGPAATPSQAPTALPDFLDTVGDFEPVAVP
jgi:hypothetical protein